MEKITKENYLQKIAEIAKQKTAWTKEVPEPKKDDENQYPLFLKPHPSYPELPLFSEQKGREPEPLFECNGMCGINDLEERKETENELNFYGELFPEQ